MPDKKTVVLVRPDGTTISATPEQAQKLQLLGYKPETVDESLVRGAEEGKAEYYQEQGVQTAIEGLARGATLGATDYIFGGEGSGVAERARYNPGIAQATEIVGAIAPELIPGLNVVAPSAQVGRLARAAIPGAGIARGAARGALEGAVFGGSAAADHAYLAGDPITAEAVLHGIGFGSLWGAGLSAAGAGLVGRGERNIAAGSRLEAEATAALNKVEAPSAAPRVFEPELKPGAFASTTQPAWASFRAEAQALKENLRAANATVDAVLSGDKRKMAQLGFERTMSEEKLGQARIEIDRAFRRVSKSMNKKGFNGEKLQERIAEYEDAVAKAATRSGLSVTQSGSQALMEYAQSKLIQKTLDKLPNTVEAFARMRPEKAEGIFASLNSASKMSNYQALSKAIDEQANQLQTAMGLAPEGLQGLRKAWTQASKAVKAEEAAVKEASRLTKEAAKDARRTIKVPKAQAIEPSNVRKGLSMVAGAAVGVKTTAMTGSWALGSAAAGLTRRIVSGAKRTPELVAARNQVLGRIKQAVGGYQVKTGKAVQLAAPKMDPLTRRLDGSVDTSSKDPSDLAHNRVIEFAQAAPHMKNTIYRAVEPIAIEQPELGPALYQAGVSAFQAMRELLPADPGVVSGLKSIWKPSRLQAHVMSKQLEVFQDPIGTAETMLATGQFEPVQIKALKAVAPAVFDQLRVEMIGKLQMPGFLDKMNYREQVALGALIDIPIHSSMKPEYIAGLQAMHTNRNQPLPTPAVTSQGQSNGGRPSDSSGATSAQITTSR